MAAVIAAIFFEFELSDCSESEAVAVLRSSHDINIVAKTSKVRKTKTVPMPYRARFKPSVTRSDMGLAKGNLLILCSLAWC